MPARTDLVEPVEDLVQMRLDRIEVAVHREQDARSEALELDGTRGDRGGVRREAGRVAEARVARDEPGMAAKPQQRHRVRADQVPRVLLLAELREQHARRALLASQEGLERSHEGAVVALVRTLETCL